MHLAFAIVILDHLDVLLLEMFGFPFHNQVKVEFHNGDLANDFTHSQNRFNDSSRRAGFRYPLTNGS